MKVLLNAEEFGFGPSAAISSMFPSLREFYLVNQLDYLGSGHSLDLQKELSYNHIFHTDSQEEFKKIVIAYDWFITAMDFEKATWAVECGVKTIVFDALFWYWLEVPKILPKVNLYLVQNFFGVQEKIESINSQNIKIVPPNVQKRKINLTSEKDLVLINFGGLQNPFWDIDVTVQYIQKILNATLPFLKGKNVKILCSQKNSTLINNILQNKQVTFSHHVSFHQMQDLLEKTEFILATPGLGNINEIANYKIPYLFLPPANDSQGQQLKLLKKFGHIKNCIDWNDLGFDINYSNSQKLVLEEIKNAIYQVNALALKKEVKKKLFLDNTKNIEKILLPFSSEEELSGCIIQAIKG